MRLGVHSRASGLTQSHAAHMAKHRVPRALEFLGSMLRTLESVWPETWDVEIVDYH